MIFLYDLYHSWWTKRGPRFLAFSWPPPFLGMATKSAELCILVAFDAYGGRGPSRSRPFLDKQDCIAVYTMRFLLRIWTSLLLRFGQTVVQLLKKCPSKRPTNFEQLDSC